MNSTKLLCEAKAGVFKGFLAVVHSDHILGVESSSQNNLMGQLDTAGTPAGVRKLWGCLLYYEELQMLTTPTLCHISVGSVQRSSWYHC